LLNLVFLVATTVPTTPEWSLKTAFIISTFTILGIIIARYKVQKPGVGPGISLPVPGFSGKEFGLSQFIAGAALGHILGAGVLLGLTGSGF